MSFSIYDASVPVLLNGLGNMSAWLDKATAEGADEKAILAAKFAEDMRPFPFQYQASSDSAKNAVARLTGGTAPSMKDEEASFAELKERMQKTIDYLKSVDRAAYDDAAERPVELKFPNGMGYRFNGADYLTKFVLPNFFFHHTMAYALLRANGVNIGKPDFLQHLGQGALDDDGSAVRRRRRQSHRRISGWKC